MNVLSLDLASRQSGWAIFSDNRKEGKSNEIVASGIIQPRPLSLSADERLPIIKKELAKIIDEYHPTFAILETPAGGSEDKAGPEKSWLTMSVLFLCHGVVRNEFQERKIKYEIISPSTWQNRLGMHKRDRSGRKTAAKEYAIKTYSLSNSLEQDIYDAVCLFDCWIYLQDWQKNSDESKERSAF
jgi:hypothetical protein